MAFFAYDYTPLNQLWTIKLGQGGAIITYDEYDRSGNLKKILREKGAQTQLAPDELNRVTHIVHYFASGSPRSFEMPTTSEQCARGAPRCIVIEGFRTVDGVFWPTIRLQVRKHSGDKWQEVPSKSLIGLATKVVIEPNNHVSGLLVNLEPFKPFRKEYEQGRIVLSDGETTEFELEYLLPPKQN